MSKARTIKWGVVLAACGAASWAGVRWGPGLYDRYVVGTGGSSRSDSVQLVAARRDTLRVVVTEEGKLKAIKNHTIFPQLRGQYRVSWLVAEGSTVKKGEKVATFDTKVLEDQVLVKGADLEGARRQLTVNEEALKIKITEGKAAVSLALTKLGDAEVALKVYKDLEAPKKLNELETAINEARAKQITSQKSVAELKQKIDDQLFIEEEQKKALDREMADSKETHESHRRIVETAILQQKIFRRYDYPQNLKTKEQALENSKLDLSKAQVSADSEVHQKEAELEKTRDTIKRLELEIKDLNEEIGRCTLTAPADGIVIYGDAGNERAMYGNDNQIKVGMEWYGNNTLMTIPDLSAFEVTVGIGEEYRGKVQPGCKASITVEAVPGLTLEGELGKISDLARSRSAWDPSSPKVFDATISLARSDKRLVSGMTARVEIVADVVEGALVVPIEGVFNDAGKTVCYVRAGGVTSKREVKPGKANDHFVQILEGLVEGEQVDLAPVRGTGSAATGSK